MYIASSKLTSKMDRICIEKYKIPEILLMENAAEVAYKRILEIAKKNKLKEITIIAGSGNNGGDGFAIARKLFNQAYKVTIISLGNLAKLSQAASLNYEIAKKIGIEIYHLEKDANPYDDKFLNERLVNSDLLIDAIFGAGLNRNIEGNYKKIIELINTKKKSFAYKIIAIDIPSGINGESGELMGISIEADYTITFEYFKKGFLRYGLEKYLGKVYVEKIGIPEEIYSEVEDLAKFIDEDFILKNLKVKKDYAHKGDFGKSLIFAGSRGFSGAAFFVTEACVKTGSGLTTLVCREDIEKILAIKLNEAMICLEADKERLDDLIERADAIAFGPGIGKGEDRQRLLKDILTRRNIPTVIDADGIDLLARIDLEDEDFKKRRNKCIITPHLGEFSRISKISIEEIEKDRLTHAKKFAKDNNLILLLKGKNTIITDGSRCMVNTTGNSAMANGGMGDCLTGIITSLCAQSYEPFLAAALGAYLHGACGDEIYKSRQVVNSSELLKIIASKLKDLYQKIKCD